MAKRHRIIKTATLSSARGHVHRTVSVTVAVTAARLLGRVIGRQRDGEAVQGQWQRLFAYGRVDAHLQGNTDNATQAGEEELLQCALHNQAEGHGTDNNTSALLGPHWQTDRHVDRHVDRQTSGQRASPARVQRSRPPPQVHHPAASKRPMRASARPPIRPPETDEVRENWLLLLALLSPPPRISS